MRIIIAQSTCWFAIYYELTGTVTIHDIAGVLKAEAVYLTDQPIDNILQKWFDDTPHMGLSHLKETQPSILTVQYYFGDN